MEYASGGEFDRQVKYIFNMTLSAHHVTHISECLCLCQVKCLTT